MRSWACLLTMAAGAFLLAGCGASQGGAGLLHSDTLAQADLQYYWGPLKIELQDCECIDQIWRLDDQLFAMTSQNRLVCMDAIAGRWLWTYQVAAPGEKVYGPCVGKQMQLTQKISLSDLTEPDKAKFYSIRTVVVNTYNHVLVLDRDHGTAWRDSSLDFAANTSGAVEGAYFYVGGADRKLHAVNLLACTQDGSIDAGGSFLAPPVVFAHSVYAGSAAGIALSAAAGVRLDHIDWKQPLQGAVNAPIAVSDLGCFVPSMDGRLYAFDQTTGLTRHGWDAPYDFASALRSGPQLSASSVFQYSAKEGLVALNAVNGTKRWNNPSALMVLACVGTDAYLLDQDNNLQIVDEVKGNAKTRLALTGFSRFAANTDMPAAFVATRDGYIACIRPTSAGKRTVEMLSMPSGQATTTPASGPAK